MLLESLIFGLITFLLTGAQCDMTEVLAEEGSQAVLPCKCSSSSSDPPAIMWRKANKGTVWKKQKSGLQYWGYSWSPKGIQRIQCPHSQFEKGDYSLQINNVSEADGGIYSCMVENGGQATENVVMLRIIKVSISPSVTISENCVLISCNVTPWPYGATVHWTLNNSPFMPQTGREAAKSVVREKATAGLTGNWTCTVGYRGKEGRASATLTLIGIIQPSKDNTKVYAAVGSAVTLPCVFSGLVPLNPVWEKLKRGSLFKLAPGHLPTSFSPSLLSSQPTLDKSATLREVEFEDEGLYRCSGTIEGQKLTRNMQLVVAEVNSSTSNKRGSVTLTCQLTDTSEVNYYEWVHVVYDLYGNQSVVSTQRGKTLRINKTSEETQGEWACRFYGKEGILGNVTYHIQLMNAQGVQKWSGLSHNSRAVIGLSCLLLLLLLVLVKMYKNHQRRKGIFPYPALETIIHTVSREQEERERNREKT